MIEIALTPSFTKSLARLTAQEQRLVDQAVMQFWRTPEAKGLRYHSLNMREARFHSISPNMDLRVIVLADGNRRAMMYVDHHDRAYNWAKGRQFESHPVTGAGQIVEFEEAVREQVVYVQREVEAPPLFAGEDRNYLIGLGVPPVYVDWVQRISGEDQLLELCERLPEEASEALLLLFDGERPEPAMAAAAVEADPFTAPDARRRFWIASDEEALARALEAPWAQWTVFLHPSQRDAVQRNFNGPVRVTGSAGTGKSVVAMHRAAEQARQSCGGGVFLTTFSRALGFRLSAGMDQLLGTGTPERGRVAVAHLHAHAVEVVRGEGKVPQILDEQTLRDWIAEAREAVPEEVADAFLAAEWTAVIDYWGVRDFAAYRAIARSGRGKALSPRERKQIWPVFEAIHDRKAAEDYATWSDLCDMAGRILTRDGLHPFRHVVVDEAQDLGPRELAYVARLAPSGPRALFFVGDTGQRIYRWPFAWKSVGIDIRGRARRLTVNYRTSQQIRRMADRLLPDRLEGDDGQAEDRRTISLLAGPDPEVVVAEDAAGEQAVLRSWLASLLQRDISASEVAILARTSAMHRHCSAPVLEALGLGSCALTEAEPGDDQISLGTLHGAKGLEFRAVAVIGCADGLLPLGSAVSGAEDGAASAIGRERQLLYVGLTRARESLLVTCGGPPSPFLEEMKSGGRR